MAESLPQFASFDTIYPDSGSEMEEVGVKIQKPDASN